MATYSKEFKEEAIRLSDEIGNKKAAAQLGIPYYSWQTGAIIASTSRRKR